MSCMQNVYDGCGGQTSPSFNQTSPIRDGAAGRASIRDNQCWQCCVPPTIETRVLYQPQKCVQPSCNYAIPPMQCPFECKKYVPKCDPLCFDWHVDEPGPNDSYGLNGLNWHDWLMENKFQTDKKSATGTSSYKPLHPGFSANPPDVNHAVNGLVCTRPMVCYSREPPYRPCNAWPPITDINYFRDWRCEDAKPPPPWRPPFKQGWIH